MDDVVVPLRVVPDGAAEAVLEQVTNVDAVVAAAFDEELVLHALVEDGADLTETDLLTTAAAAREPRAS
jgi:hypothetical protein